MFYATNTFSITIPDTHKDESDDEETCLDLQTQEDRISRAIQSLWKVEETYHGVISDIQVKLRVCPLYWEINIQEQFKLWGGLVKELKACGYQEPRLKIHVVISPEVITISSLNECRGRIEDYFAHYWDLNVVVTYHGVVVA